MNKASYILFKTSLAEVFIENSFSLYNKNSDEMPNDPEKLKVFKDFQKGLVYVDHFKQIEVADQNRPFEIMTLNILITVVKTAE